MKTQINREIILALFILMMNYENANSKENKSKFFSMPEKAADSVMQVEDWMLNEKTWNRQISADEFAIVKEDQLLLEDWMVNDKLWSGTIDNDEKVKDKKLKVEDWMVNSVYWKK